MKKIITTLAISAIFISGCSDQLNLPLPSGVSTKSPTKQTSQLGVGNMEVYDFGTLKLHAYETKDPISNENFILETDKELIVIELAPFYNNIHELQSYLDDLGKPLTSVIIAYHPAGGDAYPNAKIYASEGLGEAALVAGFAEAFGDIFDGNLPTRYDLVQPGSTTIGGVKFNVIKTDNAFDLEIPAIDVYLTHMLGHNTHNIIASTEQIDSMLAELKTLRDQNYALILTGHDTPRTNDITTEKIAYLEKAKDLINSINDAKSFIQAMQNAFPNYAGENYLEMSANIIFGAQ